MIDIENLRRNPKIYTQSAKLRGIKIDIDKLIKIDHQYIKDLGEVETLRSKLNFRGKPAPKQLTELRKIKNKLEEKEASLRKVTQIRQVMLEQIPNILAADTPVGGEKSNRQEKSWGKIKTFNFQLKDHLQLSEQHNLLDFERGAKVAGNKFYFTIGKAVKLELAITQMVFEILEKAGFTIMSVPHMVTSRIASGTGFLPRGEEHQIYKIEGEDLNLIATSEISLTGYHADEILDFQKLPLLYVGISPCYRKEAGTYGKYSKGLFRVHQFDKLEMYIFSLPKESEKMHQKIVCLEEEIVQKLEIPYRIMRIAAGDLGAPAYKKYDLEYWSPVEGEYRELTSCSNVTDFQARRLNIKTANSVGKLEYVHTLNGTALAFSRAFVALIENHQQADGSIVIPRALQNYYGDKIL